MFLLVFKGMKCGKELFFTLLLPESKVCDLNEHCRLEIERGRNEERSFLHIELPNAARFLARLPYKPINAHGSSYDSVSL